MEKNYMWINVHKSEQDMHVYLNEKIYGHVVNNSDTMSPYEKDSKYHNPNNICKGQAVKYLKTEKSGLTNLNHETDKVGLTDLNYNEYKIMKENLFNKK
jgi:hypothetical protein